jgi:hypothetical protein
MPARQCYQAAALMGELDPRRSLTHLPAHLTTLLSARSKPTHLTHLSLLVIIIVIIVHGGAACAHAGRQCKGGKVKPHAHVCVPILH